MKKIVLTLTFLGMVSFSWGQEDAFKEDIKNFLEISKVQEGQIATIESQLSTIVKGDKLPLLIADIKKELPKLNDELIALYAKHFTHNEIKELIAFYRTPIGTKLANKVSVLGKESAPLAQKWAVSLQPIIMKHIQ